ncbi:MAG: WbqC family protein [Desulfobacula sp.]|nr:WbqC family protein [Desulfobacula sp.]MBU3915830.1 WbqC family protein [bacterium]
MKKTTIAIHQPNFLPWLGYIQKMKMADAFIFLDDIQFTKGSYINRVRINTLQNPKWLTIPVKYRFSRRDTIAKVKIDNAQFSIQSHLDQIKSSYLETPYFEEGWDIVRQLYGNYGSLMDFNLNALMKLKEIFSLNCEIYLSSELSVNSIGSKRLAELVSKVNGSVYLSGDGSEGYVSKNDFSEKSIEIKYINYTHPVYPQWHGGDFRAGLSVIDAIFNCGVDNLPLF